MSDNKLKKYTSKSETIERLIVYLDENNFEPGDKIPSERYLSEYFNVSRSTLRSSLNRLVENGYLEVSHGRGYFCKKKKLNRNLQDMKSIKVLAKEQNRDLITKVIRQEVIYGNVKLAKTFRVDEDSPILELVRVRYIDGVPALLEYNYADLKRFKGLEKVDFSNIPYYKVLEVKYNAIPYKGYQEISLTTLREEEAVIFMQEENRPAIYMNGITYDKSSNEAPIEVFKSIANIKTFSFTSYMKLVPKDKE